MAACVLFIMLFILPTAFGNTFLSMNSSASTAYGTYDGYPAEYLDILFDVNFYIELNLTNYDQNLVLTFQLSGDDWNSVSNCKYKSDGTTFDCSSRKSSSTYTPVSTSQIIISMGSNIVMVGSPVKTLVDSNTITIKMQNIHADNISDAQTENNLVTLAFPTKIVSGFTDVQGLADIILTADNMDVFGDIMAETLSVRAVGPIIDGRSATNPQSEIKPGDIIDFSITLVHVPKSTETALNPTVS